MDDCYAHGLSSFYTVFGHMVMEHLVQQSSGIIQTNAQNWGQT